MHKRRQEIWEDDYRRRRYLADASAADLAQRFRDILFNCHNVTAEGKLGFITNREEMQRWLPVLTHILQEFHFRGGIPAGMTSKDDLPFITYPKSPRGFKILNGATIPDQPVIKLGKTEHMASMFAAGRIRIAAASSYADPSLNRAIKDGELSLSVFALKNETSARVLDRKTGQPGPSIQAIGDVTITESVFDFYAYCMCENYDYRLLDDFEAKAMVVIHDRRTFGRRVLNAVKKSFGDDYTYMWIPVYYVDPYNYDHTRLSAHFSKHFRYGYQHEYRFLMVPKNNRTDSLPPFFIDIGPLTDVATYYCLE
jgi:hypothetical protein